jgi:hypothetical protein
MSAFGSEPQSLVRVAHPTRFVFDTSLSDAHGTKVAKRVDQLHDRITNLVMNARVGGHPILTYLFNTIPEPDPEELKVVGDALNRIADILPTYLKLAEELKFIQYARANPHVAALAFGDIQEGFDSFFDDVLDESGDVKKS